MSPKTRGIPAAPKGESTFDVNPDHLEIHNNSLSASLEEQTSKNISIDEMSNYIQTQLKVQEKNVLKDPKKSNGITVSAMKRIQQ